MRRHFTLKHSLMVALQMKSGIVTVGWSGINQWLQILKVACFNSCWIISVETHRQANPSTHRAPQSCKSLPHDKRHVLFSCSYLGHFTQQLHHLCLAGCSYFWNVAALLSKPRILWISGVLPLFYLIYYKYYNCKLNLTKDPKQFHLIPLKFDYKCVDIFFKKSSCDSSSLERSNKNLSHKQASKRYIFEGWICCYWRIEEGHK